MTEKKTKPGAMTTEEQSVARYMYVVESKSPREIALHLNRCYSSIFAIARRKKWQKLRDNLDKKVQTRAAKHQVKKIEDVLASTTHAIAAYFRNLIKTGEINSLSVKDIKLTSDVLANVHRIHQIAKGEPTNITKTISDMPEKDLREALKDMYRSLYEDPMFDPKSLVENEQEVKDDTDSPEYH